MSEPIFTIGHSNHAAETFVRLLRHHGVERVADVRLIPKSRRHPQFAGDRLAGILQMAGIEYRHFPALGGRRRPRRDSVNTAWRVETFRGYADYMQTAPFRAAVDELVAFAQSPTAVMCAEAVWWQCHRRLLADYLIVHDVGVRHILSTAVAKPHELSEFGRVVDGGLVYPGLL